MTYTYRAACIDICGPPESVIVEELLCSEDSVTGITESRNYVRVLVQVVIY